jgi:hypothetical protein
VQAEQDAKALLEICADRVLGRNEMEVEELKELIRVYTGAAARPVFKDIFLSESRRRTLAKREIDDLPRCDVQVVLNLTSKLSEPSLRSSILSMLEGSFVRIDCLVRNRAKRDASTLQSIYSPWPPSLSLLAHVRTLSI